MVICSMLATGYLYKTTQNNLKLEKTFPFGRI